MLACAHPTFDCPVILFHNIIEVLHRSMPAILLQSTLGFEPLDGWWITGVPYNWAKKYVSAKTSASLWTSFEKYSGLSQQKMQLEISSKKRF